jgi:hypothetical protein
VSVSAGPDIQPAPTTPYMSGYRAGSFEAGYRDALDSHRRRTFWWVVGALLLVGLAQTWALAFICGVVVGAYVVHRWPKLWGSLKGEVES